MTERDNGSIIERGPGFREGLRDLPAAINLKGTSNNPRVSVNPTTQ